MGFSGGIITFFHQANSDETISVNERTGEMAKDIAMYSHTSGEELTDDARYFAIQKAAGKHAKRKMGRVAFYSS